MSDLPVNVDTTYEDDAGDASVKLHQQHHDALHATYNDISGATPDLANLGIATDDHDHDADYATAAQGALADTATQPADLGTAAAEDVGAFDAAGTASAAIVSHRAEADATAHPSIDSRIDALESGASDPEIEDWTDLGNLGATETITGAANVVRRREGTLDQACTVTIDLADNQQADLVLHQDATGGRAVTFSGVDTWATDTPAIGFRAASDVDRFRFEQIDGVTYGYWVTQPPIETIGIALSDETTAITTGTAKATLRMPWPFYVTAVRANLNTVSSSGTPTVDINEAGTTILSTKLTIDVSEKTSTTAAVAAVISDPNLADDAEVTFDIDTAGTGAKGLKVWLTGYRL